MVNQCRVLVAMWAVMFGSGWVFAGPDGFRDIGVLQPRAVIRNSNGEVVWRNDAEGTPSLPEHAGTLTCITTCDEPLGSAPVGETEQIRHMDPDWENNATCFLLFPEEIAATRFSPSQPTRPFRIRRAAFAPERAIGSGAVLFFVALDQGGYPGEYLFEGSIPAGIVNQFAGALLHITFAEDAYFSGDFHFGVGTAPLGVDSLVLYSDTGGGDATHSLIYRDGSWHTMPDIGHINSWIMEAEIEYLADSDRRPERELLDSAVSPNPFRTVTVLRYELDGEGQVEAVISDIAGRRVKSLCSGPQNPGSHALCWDGTTAEGRQVPPGVYFCRLRTDGRVRMHTMVMLE
jgi:hypothetical protein